MSNLDFPFIYCNGDSFSDENYSPTLTNATYAHFLADEINGFASNKARSGSSNRRIIRTTVHDLLEHRSLNPEQETFALIGLSYELRSEIWVNGFTPKSYEESHFVTHTFSGLTDWHARLLNNEEITTDHIDQIPLYINKKFYAQYSHGRAFFYSPYAERINLLCDLIMLKSLLEKLNIKFLIFQSPPAEVLDQEYLLDFFKSQMQSDKRILDIENFSFVQWCHDNGFKTIDDNNTAISNRHYGPDAHKQFAVDFLLTHLKETGQL